MDSCFRRNDNEGKNWTFYETINFDMRIDGSIEKVPVLVASGVTETGQKLVLGFQAGDRNPLLPGESFSRI